MGSYPRITFLPSSKPAKMSAQGRISQVAGHMNATGAAGLTEKHPDDVVVTTALRTAITKGGKGGFKDTAAADLLHGAFTGLIQRSGVPPLLMGIGPWKAIPVALEKAGVSKNDVDIYEINEAFASQCLWCANELGLPMEKINPKGGAIAFGHPLGCTGARQVSTLLYELKRTNKKIGVTSMCVGTGMGMAAVWVAE